MWLKDKIFQGQRQIFLRPEKVEFIRVQELCFSQGEGSYFDVGIDGITYCSGQKLNIPIAWGICLLTPPDKSITYHCDDSIIIAAFCRFVFTNSLLDSTQWPKRGFMLPLLSRAESRKYLSWHNIPHPATP